ncbi:MULTISPECIES: hypothetical protein [Micromonospora]|uniref:hypothetical protein n=1 Tax=Micromonospora TaxID=1873 RepID=UPI001EF7C6E5|nr:MULTISPECIES: hypothetical protein [Micromonospora]
MQRDDYRAVDGEREQRATPAKMCDQQAGQGHEDGTGEPGHDRDREQSGGGRLGVNQETMTAKAGS